MSKIITQSVFQTTEVKTSWRSQITSLTVHGILLALAFAVTFPVVQEVRKNAEHVTLIAPRIPAYKPKIQPLRLVKSVHLPVSIPVPVIPPAPKPPEIKPVIARKSEPPPPVSPPVIAKFEGSATPKPVKEAEAAKSPVVPKVTIGGFGDPNAVHASDTLRPAPVLMAKVGAFESPEGIGQSGAAGRSAAGVKTSSFGSVDAGNVSGRSQGTAIHTGGFGEGSLSGTSGGRGNATVKSSGFGDTVAAPAPKLMPVAAAAFTPVEILFKPRPSYSAEARNMRVEGQVSLEVVFQASGAVKVVRVIRGLGHGLDEAAQQAAMQVRFKPAMRGGVAVDQTATISITFELS